MKRILKISLIVILSAVLVVGAIVGGVFGYAASSAKNAMKYDKAQCVELAKTYAQTHFGEGVKEFVVASDDVSREFKYNGKDLKNSYYVYEIELKVIPESLSSFIAVDGIDLEIDTRTGEIKLVDIDR